jgi:hypothetical protein
MIDVPSKIWWPEPENKNVSLDYGDDNDNDLLVFTHYGNAVWCTPLALASAHSNVHFWNATCDNPEFSKNIWLGAAVNFETRGNLAHVRLLPQSQQPTLPFEYPIPCWLQRCNQGLC